MLSWVVSTGSLVVFDTSATHGAASVSPPQIRYISMVCHEIATNTNSESMSSVRKLTAEM